VIVAQLWNGARGIRRLEPWDPDPTAEQLAAVGRALLGDAVAGDGKLLEQVLGKGRRSVWPESRQDGVRPVVRVVEAPTTLRRTLAA
jgi:hypothetical protein